MSSIACLSLAAGLSSSYVVLLHAFDFDGVDRNDPRSIRRRFTGAAFSNFIGICCTYSMLSIQYEYPFQVMGIHTRGALTACLLPALLTSICYLGTWVMAYIDGSFWSLFDLNDWKLSLSSITWVRDTIMAPITEEIAFRACASSLVLQCLSSRATVIVAPLPFALSHLHHITDDLRKGFSMPEAIIKRGFQMLYSYLFGAYATFLFVRTGSILAPIVCHSICNNMGLPLFHCIPCHTKRSTRILLWISYLFGFILWLQLLQPLTEPVLYD